MRQENNLIFEMYSGILKPKPKIPQNGIHVGVLGHNDEKELFYSSKPEDIEFCEYQTSCSNPVFITSSNDEEINVDYEGQNVDEIIEEINNEDWGQEDPNQLNIDPPSTLGLIDYVRSTFVDSDSSRGWVLFVDGKPIACAENISIDDNNGYALSQR